MVVSKDTIVFKLFVLWCKTNFHLKGKLYTAQIDEPFRTRNTTGFFFRHKLAGIGNRTKSCC